MHTSIPSGPSNPFSLRDRTALVTGSTTGLGKSMAFALGRAGARVALNFHNDVNRAEATLREFSDTGADGMLVRADVTSEAEVARMTGEITAQLGSIDILIINATPAQPNRPIEEYDWEFCQSMVDFFFKSPFLLSRACLPHMKAQRWGRIINIGSEAFTRGVPNFTPYVAAKGAQNGFHRGLATELAPWGITVNMISPGWIPVERHAADPQEMKDAYAARIPVGRWGMPDDLCGAIVFLTSEASSFVTGQNLHINGGLTVQ